MRSMLVHESLGRVAKQQFADDDQSNIFFAIKRLLKDMAAIAVSGEFDNTTPRVNSQ